VRVLHVHTRYRQRGGEDVVVEAERSLLERSGFELESLDFQNPSTTLPAMAALARAPWNTPASGRVVETALDFDADIVHIHNTWYALSPGVIAQLRRHGLPVVMTFHNYRLVCANAMLFRDGRPCEDCVGGSLFPGVFHRCYRNSVISSTMVAVTIHTHRRRQTWTDSLSAAIALTDFARERLLQGGLPADRTIVKPNFVTDPGPRLNQPSASNKVLFVGRLSTEKGIGRLVEAWRSVNPEGLELVIVGSGPQEDEIRKLAGGSVQMVGQLHPDEVKAEMLAARALMVPSVWYEVQPMVILESLAAGLPVWHSDLGALAETVGGGGQTLGSGQPSDKEAALKGLEDDAFVDDLSARARLEYELRYTPEHAVDGLRRIYALAQAGQ
jgi:glycosyltransferase involved in cell wall biosynthesis